MYLKQFESTDLSNCTTTFIRVFNAEPWNDEWTFERAQQYLQKFTETSGFYGIVAMEEGEIIGFLFGQRKLWWSGDEFFIEEMCVVQQKQQKGVGKALLNELIDVLRAQSITSITLLTNRGLPAEQFYIKNGFEHIERLIFLHKSV